MTQDNATRSAKAGSAHWIRSAFWTVAALILLAPLVAMQFTSEVNWDRTDFVVMGVMLLVTGLALELALRLTSRPAFRIALGGMIVLIFLLVWGELAVGIFGTPWAGS